MKAAGLKAIDTVVSSTAILVKSKHPSNPAMVDLIAARIKGVISKSSIPFPPCEELPDLLLQRLTPSISCSEIRPLPVQRRAFLPATRDEGHSRPPRSHYHIPRRRRLGSRQLDGRQEEHCYCDG